MRPITIVVAVAVLAASACGPKAARDTAVAPTYRDLYPTTVTISTFYDDVDRACPAIGAAKAAPIVEASVWADLTAYCRAAPRDPSTLLLARDPGRARTLALTMQCSSSTLAGVARTAVNTAALNVMGDLCAHVSKVSDADLERLADAIAAIMDTTPGDGAVKVLTDFMAHARPEASRDLASVAGLTGVDLTSIADVAIKGLAQFLVKRAELELRVYAIDKMRKAGQCDKALDTSVVHGLLVSTCEFLGGDTGTLPAGFGPGLRAAFAQDIAALPRNLARQVPAEGGASELIMRVALESAAIVVDDPDPMQIVVRVQILADVTGDGAFTCTGKGKGLQGCLDTKATLYAGAELARIILSDGDPIRLTPEMLFEGFGQRLVALRKHVAPESTLGRAIDALLPAGSTVDSTAWKVFFGHLDNDAAKVIDGLRAAHGALAKVSATSTDLERAQAVVDATRFGTRAIDRAVAIAACLSSATTIASPPSCATDRVYLPGQLADFLDALRRKDLGGVMAMGLAMTRGALGTSFTTYVPTDVARLLSFGAELASAKDSKEAEAAIEAIAMAPGGYKEKRKRDFFSVTGLVGAGVGVERVSGAERSTGFTAGLMGAVGIDYNHHFAKSAWTVGGYLTVLDLGGIINLRSADQTADGEVAAEPTVGFAQVFSPGIGIRFGIGDSPLVLLLGGQVIPRGRTITTSDGGTPNDTSDDTTSTRSAVRLMASLGVDVTIWAF